MKKYLLPISAAILAITIVGLSYVILSMEHPRAMPIKQGSPVPTDAEYKLLQGKFEDYSEAQKDLAPAQRKVVAAGRKLGDELDAIRAAHGLDASYVYDFQQQMFVQKQQQPQAQMPTTAPVQRVPINPPTNPAALPKP